MTFARNLRTMLSQSFLSLPLLLIGYSLFMGVSQGNIGLFVLFLGQITVVPLATMLFQTVWEFVLTTFDVELLSKIQVVNADVCTLIPGSIDKTIPFVNTAPSYWLAHIIFFFSFLISNGFGVMKMKAAESADPEKVENRMTQATLSIGLTIGVLIALIAMRFILVGCETGLGLLLGGIPMALLGYAWYNVAKECSARDSDIFGIVQKVLPPSALDPPPMTCVYTG
jgi:hypothetical protein